MFVWIMEFLTAFSHYVVAYATEMWFFTPYMTLTLVGSGHRERRTPPYAVCTGYADGMRYHLGSFALGAVVIMWVRGPRLVMRLITYVIAAGNDNLVSKCIWCACACCLNGFEYGIKVLSKDAWMDVAVNGNPFCQAAFHSLMVLEHEATAAITMHGACWLIQAAGIGFVSITGGGTAYLMCTLVPGYSNPESAYYVSEPQLVSFIASAVCTYVCVPFVLLFQDVSDTILFCFALEQKRESLKPVILQAVDQVCWGRTERDPLAKVERRLAYPTDAQNLFDEIKRQDKRKGVRDDFQSESKYEDKDLNRWW